MLQIVTTKPAIRCFAVSDLHVDKPSNFDWVKSFCRPTEHDQDEYFSILIVPGDVATSVVKLGEIFAVLVARFDAVCFTPGNHELWRQGSLEGRPGDSVFQTRQAIDSIEKLDEVLRCAISCGVYISPLHVRSSSKISPQAVVVHPLFSWYHKEWDTETALSDPLFLESERICEFPRRWSDFHFCAWPASLVDTSTAEPVRIEGCRDVYKSKDTTAIARAFAELNEPVELPPYDQSTPDLQPTIISYSHFLPFIELVPEKRFLLEPSLHSVCGSNYLQQQVLQLKPMLHVFGHTHIPMDLELHGTRFVQWPLGSRGKDSPADMNGPMLVFDSSLGSGKQGIPSEMPSLRSQWSCHYRNNARTPDVVAPLSPWLENKLRQFVNS